MFHRYQYFFWPRELAFLCETLSETLDVPGDILEIGCANGSTTVFLNKHLDSIEVQDREGQDPIEKRYHCIDTFSGFTEEDIQHETEHRDKNVDDYFSYSVNDVRWFQAMLEANGVQRARAIKADANTFDFSQFTKISFCLVDVDLYRPVKSSLEAVYDLVSPGGIIVVDDCKPNSKYDGALEAYREFIGARSLDEELRFGKFGLIRKAAE